MSILSTTVDRLKANPLVAGGALLGVVLAGVQAAQAHPTPIGWAATVAPLALGWLGQFTTVPWSKVKPLVEQAAVIAGASSPSAKAWADVLSTALDAAGPQTPATPPAQSETATQGESQATADPPPASLDQLSLALHPES